MPGTKNTIASALEQFMILQRNSIEIIEKMQRVATASTEGVVFNITEDDGTVTQYQVPSMGYLKSRINRLDNTVEALAGLGDSNAVIRMPDGTTKRIFEAEILRDPSPITTVQVPKQFNIKNNWFFESFLNPLMYISYDVATQVPADMERAVVKRIIVYTDTEAKKTWFDDNYKGRNDVSHDALLIDLDTQDIQYFLDEEVVDLPLSVIRYSGEFDVTNIVDEDVTITSNERTVTVKKRKYKLNKLTYTDVLSGTLDSKTLEVGLVLITEDGSKYEIEAVDTSRRQIVLKRISGSQPITIGAGVLSVYSQVFASKSVQVNVGYDERQVVFIKPVEAKFNVASSSWSPGTAMWTNELTIQTPTGAETLESFYKSQVVDFGMQFLNSAKERLIPAVLGEQPNAPTLDVNSFQVVPINDHKKDTKEVEEINNKLAQKVSLENEVRQLDEAIDEKKNDLNNNSSTKSDADKKKIKADLESLAREKTSKVNLYSSVVKELSTKAKSNPVVASGVKHRVRGFFPMPEAATSDTTAPQEAVQFLIATRYIKKDGNAPQTKQMEFTDSDGTPKTGFFSNWNEMRTALRPKVYNEDTGFYEWATEDVADADAVNINQIDIPISKGEQVQIRVKTISEAGWPTNPLESEWSDVITIDFPDDLQIEDETAATLSEVATEETRVRFQEELAARGLDLHLLGAFTSGDRYFSHKATDITSGFYTPEGKVIDLYEKLKAISDELITLRQLIEAARGFLSVFLIDADGNVTKIGANSTTKVFAGYYKELITSGSGQSITLDHGKIITKSFVLRIENGAATDLELASYMPGGQGVLTDDSSTSTNNDYANNRQYDLVPLALTGEVEGAFDTISQAPPFQSGQAKSLWMYNRQRSVGLDEDLYALTQPANNNTTIDQGVVAWTGATPVNGCFLVPTDPTATGGNADVWDGNGGSGNGGGTLTEFCIHKDHPDITGPWAATDADPSMGTAPNYLYTRYPRFLHSDFFWKDSTDPDGKKQLQYIHPDTATPTASSTNPLTWAPAKIGFRANDEWLMGKYTCGAYLYTAPVGYNDIAVDGSTELAKRLLEFGEEKAVNIPIVFQFRCSDKLGYVGGYRSTGGNISNITYIKKIGIDLQARNESLFSFDIEVSCKYEQDSLSRPVYIPNVGLERLNAIRTQATSSGTSESS